MSVRVLIADDHAPTRTGVRLVLEAAGHRVCGEASTAEEAIRLALGELPDVCVLDIQMPGNGIRAAAEISAHAPDIGILILTVSLDRGDFLDALRAGALGFLHKDMDPTGLAPAVEAIAAGEGVLDGQLSAVLIDEFRRRGAERAELVLGDRHRVALTPREWDVLELLGDGLSTAEIAERLFLSQVTIRRHVSMIMGRVDVSTRDQLRALLARRAS